MTAAGALPPLAVPEYAPICPAPLQPCRDAPDVCCLAPAACAAFVPRGNVSRDAECMRINLVGVEPAAIESAVQAGETSTATSGSEVLETGDPDVRRPPAGPVMTGAVSDGMGMFTTAEESTGFDPTTIMTAGDGIETSAPAPMSTATEPTTLVTLTIPRSLPETALPPTASRPPPSPIPSRMTRSTRPTFSSSSSSSSQPTTTNTTTSSTASTTPTPTPITAHPAGGPSRSLSLGIGLGFGLLLLLLALFTAWYLCARKRRTPPSPLASTSLHAGRSSPVEGAPAAAAALQRHGLTEEEVSLDSDEAAWQRAPLAGPQAVYIGDGRWRESRDGRWRESRVRPGPPVLPALDLGEESLKWEGLRRFEEGGTERI